ncbi:hypothetical protein JKP88DRAFT_302262 [Tribonema minus]|uniref:SAP domain-containing protein n=1 Tax=Tribonema minus TaxID=303371 RepID=A0A835ZA07_9STRA|nr:hypothetical protein JKP88DRAFT_302262 [Tribonema minus]
MEAPGRKVLALGLLLGSAPTAQSFAPPPPCSSSSSSQAAHHHLALEHQHHRAAALTLYSSKRRPAPGDDDDFEVMPVRGPMLGPPPPPPRSDRGTVGGRGQRPRPQQQQLQQDGGRRFANEVIDRSGDRQGRGGGGGGRGGAGGRGAGSANAAVKAWQSGAVLLPRGGRGGGGGRRDANGVPWYLQEVQDQGLDTLGDYAPWWRDNRDPAAAFAALRGLKVEELKRELSARGLPVAGRKDELLERLRAALERHSMGDDGFVAAPVCAEADGAPLPKCFPAAYEDVYHAHGAAGHDESVPLDAPR